MRRAALTVLFCAAMAIASPAQIFTKLADFNGIDGAQPSSALVQGSDGNLYGTTFSGADGNGGTIFEITSQGELISLYSFCSPQSCDGGYNPMAGLVQATDGNFYGTTVEGGTAARGTVFRYSPAIGVTVLHSFLGGQEGASPSAGLVQGKDADFYGTTTRSENTGGTIFRITLKGALTTLYRFCSQPGCADGNFPQAGLVQGADGNFYGTTLYGGYNNNGTVFKVTPEGTLTTLHTFCPQDGCTDGSAPYAALVQGDDGNFYGTTVFGGTHGYGTIFRISPSGTLTTLHSYDQTDGANPNAGLLQGGDGNLYGTTSYGGNNNYGTLFEITPKGALTTLHSFDSYTDGAVPNTLVQATDGSFYGTTLYGEANGYGTVFRLLAYATLSVTKFGMGTVISGDGHLYCGKTCSYTYLGGAQVSLTAIPAPGYTFSGWTGCDTVQGNTCSLSMLSDRNVSATFTQAQIPLTSLVLKPTSVKGGNISIATLTLGQAAPPGGFGVGMSSDHPLVVQPPSLIVVPGGKTSISFAVRTTPVRSRTVATITATANASQQSSTLTVSTSYALSQQATQAPPRTQKEQATRTAPPQPNRLTSPGPLPR